MKTPLKLMVLSLFLGSTVILAGCGEAKKKEPAATPPPAADGDHDHEEGEDHDHAEGDEAKKDDDAAKADDGAAAKDAPAEQATASYSPKMSDDGETQMVSLNLPNMT
ncbi:MAG: hypothetical protein MK108_05840 [Mariniblastus sp.]|nr:hypothetical protein [Mariniblastus sp.]